MAVEHWKVHYQYNWIDFVEPIEGESIGSNLSRFQKKKPKPTNKPAFDTLPQQVHL